MSLSDIAQKIINFVNDRLYCFLVALWVKGSKTINQHQQCSPQRLINSDHFAFAYTQIYNGKANEVTEEIKQ